jgi:predicted Zn-dependent protease
MNSIFKYLISVLFLTVLVSACSSTPTGRAQLTLKSEAILAQEGARQMAIIREQAPLVQDRATIDFVACVADAIVGVLNEKDAALYWELAVVNQPDVNAFVMPGGKIVVKAGILSVTQNQHQLAAVVGHEVAHVTAHHANERASRAVATTTRRRALTVRYRLQAPWDSPTRSAACRKRKRMSSDWNTWQKPASIRVKASSCGRT